MTLCLQEDNILQQSTSLNPGSSQCALDSTMLEHSSIEGREHHEGKLGAAAPIDPFMLSGSQIRLQLPYWHAKMMTICTCTGSYKGFDRLTEADQPRRLLTVQA